MSESGGPDLSRLRRLSEHAKPPRPERDVNLMRVAAFLAAAVVVITVPWLVFTRIGDPGPATGRSGNAPRASRSPSAGTSASPSVSPSATALPDAGVYEVVGDVKCARIRIEPGTDQEIVNCVEPGTRLESDGQLRESGGFTWLHVEDPFRGIDGWIATQYVKRVA